MFKVKIGLFFVIIIMCGLGLGACSSEATGIRSAPTLPPLSTATPTLSGFVVLTPTPTLPPFGVEVRNSPTPTVIPTATSKPTATPPPTPTYRPTPTIEGQLPILPPYTADKPDEAAKVAANWLNAQPDAKPKDTASFEVARDRLKTLLLGWKATAQLVPIELSDLDGDGQVELVTTLVDNWREPTAITPDHGSVLVLTNNKGSWVASPVLRATMLKSDAREDFVHPVLLKVEDLNKDGKPEIIFSQSNCGATTCFITVNVVNWQAGKWVDLTPQPPTMPSAEITFETSNDGTGAVVLFGGTFSGAGAGLQRYRREYYRWDKAAKAFKLSETRFETSSYLYFRVIDGNAASEKGSYPEAILFYNDALNTNTLKLWARERGGSADAINAEKLSLTAFSRFRLAVTYALQDNRSKASELLKEANDKDGVYGGWAQTFQPVYSSGTVKDACKAVVSFTEQNKSLLEPLNQFGSANPPFTPESICPFSK